MSVLSLDACVAFLVRDARICMSKCAVSIEYLGKKPSNEEDQIEMKFALCIKLKQLQVNVWLSSLSMGWVYNEVIPSTI